MAYLMRAKLHWTGFTGAPGYSVFHFRDFDTVDTTLPTTAQAQAAADRIHNFAVAFSRHLPAAAAVQAHPEVEIIDEATGRLEDVRSIVPGAKQAGSSTNTGGYAAASGAVINWRTQGVRNGRRIRGRTFLVPLSGTAFDSSGTLTSACMTDLNTAATGLTNTSGSPDLGVYARPTAPGAADGNWVVASSFTIPDMAAVLRSRRD